MIFAERKRLEQPIEKAATRNMFYDEQGRHVRTKKEILDGVAEVEILKLKKTKITERVKESVEQNGKKLELFGNIVRAAVVLLERLIAKVMQKAMEFAEKVIGKSNNAVKETSKDMDDQIYAKANPAVQLEKEKIPFLVNTDRKSDRQNKVEQSQQESTVTVKKSVIEQMDAEQNLFLLK